MLVSQITSLTRKGLQDWYVQRISAIILALYAVFIFGFVVGHRPLDFQTWYALFHHTLSKAFTLLALLALIGHAWVGMWTVFTDYIPNKTLRLIVISLMIVLFVVYVVWAIQILWF
jgi:succinate dehydrogenase / fumarate reductase membrane anchor subunit